MLEPALRGGEERLAELAAAPSADNEPAKGADRPKRVAIARSLGRQQGDGHSGEPLHRSQDGAQCGRLRQGDAGRGIRQRGLWLAQCAGALGNGWSGLRAGPLLTVRPATVKLRACRFPWCFHANGRANRELFVTEATKVSRFLGASRHCANGAIDRVRRAGLRPALDSPIGMGF